jgi:hypothetical protein
MEYISLIDSVVAAKDYVNLSGEWDFPKLISQLPPHMIEYIKACPLPMPDDIEDTIAWKAASDGAFSTANALNFILQV